MGMPKRAQIKKAFKEIEKREKNGEIVVSKIEIDQSTISGKIKYILCKSIIRIKREKSSKNNELALLMDVDSATASRVTHYRVARISLEKILI